MFVARTSTNHIQEAFDFFFFFHPTNDRWTGLCFGGLSVEVRPVTVHPLREVLKSGYPSQKCIRDSSGADMHLP